MANVNTPDAADKMTIVERVARVMCVDILDCDPDGGTANLADGETKAWEQFTVSSPPGPSRRNF